MLFGSGQFKIAVCIFFLASCLGQEQFRVCERDNERNIERVLRSDLNDLRERHRFRYENFEKEESRLLMNRGFNDIHDRRADRERLSEQTRREEPKIVERQIKSDVTRHLNDKTDEQRECLRRLSIQDEVRLSDIRRNQRESLRQLNEHDDTNQERYKTLARLDNRDVQRRSEDNREERHENLRQLDLESRRLDKRSFTPRYDETKQNREQRLTTLRSENSKFLFDTRQRSVVARDFRDDEQLSQTQRRFEYGEQREERYEVSRRLVEPEQQREISRRLEFDHKIRSDDYLEQRKVNRRNENESEQCHDENKRERNINRRLSGDIRKAETDLSTPSERETRDVRKRNAKNRESHRNGITFSDDSREDTLRQINDRSENVRETRHEAQRHVSRRSEDNLQAQQDILRRPDDIKSERDKSRRSQVGFSSCSLSERESTTRRSENQFERKLDDSEVQRYVSRQLEDNRNEYQLTFERFDELETQPDTYRRSEDVRDSQRSNELHSQRKRESAQRQDNIRESLRLVNRASFKERNSIHPRDRNEQEFKDRYETSKRLAEREVPNDLGRSSEIIRESQREIERSSRRQHETKQERQNRVERRFEERNIQNDDGSRLEVRREEHHDAVRRHDDRENLQETLRRLNNREAQLDVSRRSGDGVNSRRIDIRLPLRERKLIQHRDEIMSERVDRREDCYNREVQRDINMRLNEAREEYYQTRAQLTERDVRQWLDDGREAQRIDGNTHQRERRSIKRHDINKEEHQEILPRLDDRKAQSDISRRLEESRYNKLEDNDANRRDDAEQKSLRSSRYLSQMERENQHTFTLKQKNSNANYMILGQAVILAYVIMKTLNGKNDFKNHLFIKLREGLEIIGVF